MHKCGAPYIREPWFPRRCSTGEHGAIFDALGTKFKMVPNGSGPEPLPSLAMAGTIGNRPAEGDIGSPLRRRANREPNTGGGK